MFYYNIILWLVKCFKLKEVYGLWTSFLFHFLFFKIIYVLTPHYFKSEWQFCITNCNFMWILLCSATKWHLIKGVFPIHNHCSQDPDQDNVVTEDCDWGYFFSTKHFASWNIIFYHMINWLQGLYGTSSRRDAIAIKWPPFHHQHQNSSKYIFFITNKCWPDLIWSSQAYCSS